MAIPWVKKYSPSKPGDVVGQKGAVNELKNFVKKHKGKAALLYGSTGNGKTSSVIALARDMDYDLIEINASDTRNASAIKDLLGKATKQASLFNKGKLILFDEIDGLSGRSDRGGLSEVAKMLGDSAHPIVMTVNDPFDRKFNAIRKKCVMIKFEDLEYKHVYEVLKNIAKKENIKFDDQALKSLARQSGSDVRAAINDLQAMSSDGTFNREDLEALGDRDRTETMLQALLKVFKTTDASIALRAFDNVNEDLDKIFLWVEENIPKEYLKPNDLYRALDAVAEADRYFGRIRRWQYYRFYAYCYTLLSAGIALAKDEKYSSFVQYKPTSRLLKIWIANQKNLKKKSISQRIGDSTHSSMRRALHDTYPYFKAVSNTKKGKLWAEAFGVTDDEKAWLSK